MKSNTTVGYNPLANPYEKLRAIDREEQAKREAGTLTWNDIEDYFNRAKECYIQINHFRKI